MFNQKCLFGRFGSMDQKLSRCPNQSARSLLKVNPFFISKLPLNLCLGRVLKLVVTPLIRSSAAVLKLGVCTPKFSGNAQLFPHLYYP
jgi:hypothetical protein